MNLAHKDIKLENLIVDNNYNVKLSDFGFAEPLNKQPPKFCGTDFYMAFELYSDNYSTTSEKLDVFSLGMLLYAMMFSYTWKKNDHDTFGGI